MRRDALLYLLMVVYAIPGLDLVGYGVWQAAKVGGRAAWGIQRAELVLGTLWPLIVVLVASHWCWTRLSQGRSSR